MAAADAMLLTAVPRRAAAPTVAASTTNRHFLSELMLSADNGDTLMLEGATVTEVPVNHRMRRHGVSKYGISNRLFVGIVDVFAVRWMQNRVLRYRIEE